MSTGRTGQVSAMLAGGIAVASVVGGDPAGWYPFGPAKWYAVVICVVLATWATLLSDPIHVNDEPRLGWLLRRLWFVLLALLSVAAVVGREPIYAWIGTPERRLGVLTWLMFATCCWIGTQMVTGERRRTIARAVTLAALANGAYSGIELARGAPIPVATVGERIGGPYGSSAFLAAALCLLIPVPASVAVDRSEPTGWRAAGGLAALLGGIALIGSGTRAGFVGIAFGAIVLVAARTVVNQRKVRPKDQRNDPAWTAMTAEVDDITPPTTEQPSGERASLPASPGIDNDDHTASRTSSQQVHHRHLRRRAPIMLALAVVGIALAAGVGIGLGAGSSAAERVDGNLERVVDVGASSRFDEWAVGARIVSAHPLLGVGPEGYRTALDDGITADYERAYGRDVIPDRAHNGIIDVAAAGGVMAGALYLALLCVAGVAAWRHLRFGDPLQIGFAVAAVAYIGQQVFLFPVATIDPVFWLFVGLIISSGPSRRLDRQAPTVMLLDSETASRREPSRIVLDIAAGTLLLLVLIAAVLGVAADRLARTAETTGVPAMAQRATNLRPDEVRYWMLAERSQPMTISGIRQALSVIDRAARVSPRDPFVNRRDAERRLDLAIATGESADVADAVSAWDRLSRDINCYRCHLGYGYALALAGDVTAARRAFSRAAALAPEGDTEAEDNVRALSASRTLDGADSQD